MLCELPATSPLPTCLAGKPPYSCPGGDLSGLKLAGLDLADANLTNANLTGTSFVGVTSIAGANLTGATMGQSTDFSGCDLSTTNFGSKPNFGSNPNRPTIFKNATVPYTALGSTWSMLDLANATIVDMPKCIEFFEVDGCNISGLDFSNMSLGNAHFTGVVAHGAKFVGGQLSNIVFGERDMAVSDLTGANLSNATIQNGVFDTSTLDGASFAGSTLTDATFLNTSMAGTIFDHTDVTSCTFSSPPRWSRSPGNNTSFEHATLNLSTIQRQWSFLDLTSATIVGLDPSVDLTYLQARYAVLDGLDLAGYTINNSDLTGASVNGTNFTQSKLQHALMLGLSGKLAIFDDVDLSHARLDPITSTGKQVVARTSLHGVSCKAATMTRTDVTGADFGPAGAQASSFDQSAMAGLAAASADFTMAKLTGGIAMHGANFANATLKQADLTGVALGSLAQIFAIPRTDQAQYTKFLTALNAADVATVVAIFAEPPHSITLPTNGTTITPITPNKAWTVKDVGETYTVLLVTAADATQSLQVFQASTSGRGTLSGAFMPDAVLNDANLANVDAHGLQIFPVAASNQLAGAVLYGIDLSDAILGSDVPISLAEANLFHATLTNAFMSNANLAMADLTGSDLDSAQLQGANLTDATMGGSVSMNNAAVSTLLETSDGASVYGVCLFELSADAAEYSAVLGELAESATLSLATAGDGTSDYADLIADLNAHKLAPVAAALANQQVTLSPNASLQTVDRDTGGVGVAWQITNPDPVQGQAEFYTVWSGYDLLGDKGVYARPSLTNLRSLFQARYQIDLAWQTTVTADSHSWQINNNTYDPTNLTPGYGMMQAQETGNGLLVSGTSLRATRMSSQGHLEMRVITFKDTVLCRNPPCDATGQNTVLQADTVCPNGSTLATNQNQGISWSAMLRTRNGPPEPPPCVPSPVAPCRQ